MIAPSPFASDVETINRSASVGAVLGILSEVTGLNVALVARVTADSWTTCAILDKAGFGLSPGDTLEVTSTY